MPTQLDTSFSDNTTEWRQGELLEVTITDLSDRGDGVGRAGSRVVFVPDTVTGDRALVRLMHVKPNLAHAKLYKLLEASPHRIRPGCIVADKCGGCQWQHVDYDYQREAKRNQVVQALERIGGFRNIAVDPVLNVSEPLHYRNKSTYPLGSSNTRQVQAGYYQKGTHQIVNLNQCPIQDERLNPLLAEVKQDIQQQGWRIYDEKYHRGQLRHLALRIGQRTGEILLTLITADPDLPNLEAQAQEWLQRYENLVGVSLNVQRDRTNAIFGSETHCIAGQPFLSERFANLTFHIRPDTFFQVHTEQTEALLNIVLEQLNLQGDETFVDAYCGIGTMTLPIAQRVKTAIGLEIQPEAIEQAQQNASLNGIENVRFEVGAVEKVLQSLEIHPDLVMLDPPRKGCDATVLETLRQQKPKQIVYVSCNAATLARDLKLLCADDAYQLIRVQPADFFPQTAHVECAAFLNRVEE
ncbi:MAG: 23S rRNA (uracil(1939)-C(5))-methyltransferase RlmD [Leptolyngbya sp. UWPOB_LEPTO1]|uniref:23S rRNA (uracil(1939)-C(5))-methyltransferase RlmD n=1 Tax=Leptolyngbya sp. UWPOB_LEPTO1 TaxID=2815653 RepID=UPI001ACD35FC|nr:23S rRNA (uracil(1939)-C(5))-methyltransferase RlmD [Leptolyngbya sp. UWPOB_LEPTO1]MBN8559369.1 23S rRNA (uracil(1939)-C(5))-methyltransferase RlmD [Leptolyngbya sp. UWPOB_LEPTO1]